MIAFEVLTLSLILGALSSSEQIKPDACNLEGFFQSFHSEVESRFKMCVDQKEAEQIFKRTIMPTDCGSSKMDPMPSETDWKQIQLAFKWPPTTQDAIETAQCLAACALGHSNCMRGAPARTPPWFFKTRHELWCDAGAALCVAGCGPTLLQ